MNDVIQLIQNHRSIRKYKDKDLEQDKLDAIIASARSAASSINGQQVSIIAVKDPEKKRKIAELSGNQKWIDEAPIILIFCLDFYRAYLGAKKNNRDLVITNNVESIMVGSIDLGLAMSNAMLAAQSMDLGIVNIGGIRNDPEQMIQLLDLPPYVYPGCGLVIGYPDQDPGQKPRLPKEAVFFEEKYNKNLQHFIDDYDKTIEEYTYKRSQGQGQHSWTEPISGYYSRVYYPNVSPTLTQQKLNHE